MVSRGAARAAARGLVRPRARAQGRVRVDARGRARPPLVGDLRRQPGRLLRAPHAVPDQGRGPGRARADPAREGAHPSRGHRRDGRRDRAARPRVAAGGRGGGEGRHLGGGRRPAHAAPSRRGGHRRLGAQDDALRHGARSGDARWLRRRARRGDPARRLRLARRADRARRCEVRAARVRAGDGAVVGARTPPTFSTRSAGRWPGA